MSEHFEPNAEELRALLNAQTGKTQWKELERHFASGSVLKVAPGTDLVEVAARVVEDDRAAVEAWLADGTLARATLDDARDWTDRDPVLWAVVAAPWVLVMEDVEE
jgi:hypothetical protein